MEEQQQQQELQYLQHHRMAGIGSRFSGCSGESSAAAAGFHVPQAPSTTPRRFLAENSCSHHLLSSSSRAYHAGTSGPGQAGFIDAVGSLEAPPQPPPPESLSHLAPSLALLASLSDICASSSTPAPGSRVKPGSEHNFEASGAHQASDAPSPCRITSAFSSYRRPASFREAPVCVLSDSNLCLQATVGLGNLYYEISRKVETESSVAAAAAAVAQWDGCWSRESTINRSSNDLKGKTVFRSISERVPEGTGMVCVRNDGGLPGGATLPGSLSLKHAQQQQQQMYDQTQYFPGSQNGVYSDTYETMKRGYQQSDIFNAQYPYQLQQHQSMLGNKQIQAPRGFVVEPDQMYAPGRIAMDEEPAGDNECSEIDWTMSGGQLRIGPHLPLLAGRFRYLEALSEGGSAKVFTAVDLLHPRRRTVVIKAMHKHYREVGLQEQQLLRHLNSMDPDDTCHIVRLISGFEFKGHTCLVLERLQGSLLEHMCAPERQAQTLTERIEEIRRLALHLIVALATLHSAGVIHGDLKPENVLLQAPCPGGSAGCPGGGAGGSASPTLSFPGSCSCSGLSSSSSFSSRSSSSGAGSWAEAGRAPGCAGAPVGVKLADLGNSFTPEQIKGLCRDFNVQTLAYRAPEVLLGIPFDARIDMWSLGCILAELALGRLLFACDCPSQLLQQMGGMLGLPPPRYLFGHGKFFHQLHEEASLSTTEDPYESLLGAPAMAAAAAAAAAAGSNSNWPTPGCGVYNPAAQGSLLPMKLNFCSPGRSYLGDVLLKVDAQLADLVCCLLQYDPSCRLTAHQALLHPFFAPLFPFRTSSPNNMQPQHLSGLLRSAASSPQQQQPTRNDYQQQQQHFQQSQVLQQQAVGVKAPCASPLDYTWMKPLPSEAAATTASPETLLGGPASPFTLGPAALASGARAQTQQHSQRLLQVPSQLQLAEQQQQYGREQLQQQQQWQQPQQVLHAEPSQLLGIGWNGAGAPAQPLGSQQLLRTAGVAGASHALNLSAMQQQQQLSGASSGAQAALLAMGMLQRNQLGTMRGGSSNSTNVGSPVEMELLSGNGSMAYASTASQQQQQQQLLPHGMALNKASLLQLPTLTLSQQQSQLDASRAGWAAGAQAQVSYVPSTPGSSNGAAWGSSHHAAWAGAGGQGPGAAGTRSGASAASFSGAGGLGAGATSANNQPAWDINVEPDRNAQVAALHAGYTAGGPTGAGPVHVPSKRALPAASTLVVDDGGLDVPLVGGSQAGAPRTPFRGSEARPRVSWSRTAKVHRMPEGPPAPPAEHASNGGAQLGVSKSASQSWGKTLQSNDQWGAGYPTGLVAASQQGGGLSGHRYVGEEVGNYGGPTPHLLQGSKSMQALQQHSGALQSATLIQQQQLQQAQQQFLHAQQQQLLQAQQHQQQQQLMLQQQQNQRYMAQQQQQPQHAGHFVQPYMAAGHQLASVQPAGNAGGLFVGNYAYLAGLGSNGLVA